MTKIEFKHIQNLKKKSFLFNEYKAVDFNSVNFIKLLKNQKVSKFDCNSI